MWTSSRLRDRSKCEYFLCMHTWTHLLQLTLKMKPEVVAELSPNVDQDHLGHAAPSETCLYIKFAIPLDRDQVTVATLKHGLRTIPFFNPCRPLWGGLTDLMEE